MRLNVGRTPGSAADALVGSSGFEDAEFVDEERVRGGRPTTSVGLADLGNHVALRMSARATSVWQQRMRKAGSL